MPQNLISNQEVIPEIESRLFVNHETAQFAVGIVAVGNEVMPGFENEFAGYALLRGNVYAKQKNYMPEDDLNDDGTESDPDDARSVHFVVVENAVTSPRVVGAMRLIIKSRENDAPLPIEEHYPDAVKPEDVPILSTEASRVISRHESAKVQRGMTWLLFSAGLTHVMENNLGPVFGAVERVFTRSMRAGGMPLTELADAEYVPEFNAVKQPIRIDVGKLAEYLQAKNPELMSAMERITNDFVYSGQVTEPAAVDANPKQAVA